MDATISVFDAERVMARENTTPQSALQWLALQYVSGEMTEGQAAGRAMEMAAVKVSLSNLRTFPFVQEGEGAGTLKLRGAHFAISDGILRILNNESGQFEPA